MPVKLYLEAQGYEVKSEIRFCDVVGMRPGEVPVIVELKQAMSLALLYQAIERLAVTEHVYIAIARPKRGIASSAVKLCRRLGLGLMIVTAAGSIEVMADPVAYTPRQNTKKRGLLLKEFNARSGDPNLGGSTRTPLMTAYRQDAIRCADYLSVYGPTRISVLKAATQVDRAAAILRGNVYGWFQKAERGIYELSSLGKARG